MRHQVFCQADSAPNQIVPHFYNQAPMSTDISSSNNIQTDCMASDRLDDLKNTFSSVDALLRNDNVDGDLPRAVLALTF
jgi:hypothetical protein